MTQAYAIVWRDISEDSEIGQRCLRPGQQGQLPFLIDGEPLERHLTGKSFDLDEFMLLRGLLHSWDERPADAAMLDQDSLHRLMELMKTGFGFIDVEGLILGVAHKAREENGHLASYRMLRNGSQLIPESSRIRSDQAMDIGCLLAEPGDSESEPLLAELLDLTASIQADQVPWSAAQVLLVLRFAALKFTDSDPDVVEAGLAELQRTVTNPELLEQAGRIARSDGAPPREAFSWLLETL